MALALIYPGQDMSRWREELLRREPEMDVRTWPELGCLEDIEFALAWAPPPGLLAAMPNLLAVSSLGDGVDHILCDRQYPRRVPLVRLAEKQLPLTVAHYAVHAVIEFQRRFDVYRRQQETRNWQRCVCAGYSQWRVGLMGYGKLGREAGRMLQALDYPLSAWARSPHADAPIKVWHGSEQLAGFLEQSNILICLLPLTGETEGILNARLFQHLPPGAYLVNLGRGEHLVDADLVKALDNGRLSGARLDVFRREPLPPDDPLWTHPLIQVTPHIAAGLSEDEHIGAAVPVVLENIRRARNREPLIDRVDPDRGY